MLLSLTKMVYQGLSDRARKEYEGLSDKITEAYIRLQTISGDETGATSGSRMITMGVGFGTGYIVYNYAKDFISEPPQRAIAGGIAGLVAAGITMRILGK